MRSIPGLLQERPKLGVAFGILWIAISGASISAGIYWETLRFFGHPDVVKIYEFQRLFYNGDGTYTIFVEENEGELVPRRISGEKVSISLDAPPEKKMWALALCERWGGYSDDLSIHLHAAEEIGSCVR